MNSVEAGQRSRRGRHKQGQSGADPAPRGSKRRSFLALGGFLIIFAVAAWATRGLWLPRAQAVLASVMPGELDKRGVEPVPMPAKDIGFFGGSLRCSTLPLSRDA